MDNLPYGPLSFIQIQSLNLDIAWMAAYKDFVRFNDLDVLNHVNNKVYLTWFETLRLMYMNALGVSFSDLESLRFVVRDSRVEYFKPMIMTQDYVVLGRTSRIGNTSFVMDYAVWDDSGVYTATGHAQLVMMDSKGLQSVRIPDEIRKIMIGRDKAEQI